MGLVLVFALFLLAPHLVLGYNETLCQQERSQWLDEYRNFHRANRGAPGARYLVYYCGPNQNLCAGTGDRIRGMLWLMRIAAVHRMVYIADWSRPTNLTTFLQPNELDWRIEGLPADIVSKVGKEHNTFSDGDFMGLAEHGHNLDRWKDVKIHTTTAWPASIVDHRVWNTTLWPNDGFLTLLGPLGGVHKEQSERWHREYAWYIDISACWLQYAFKPTEVVSKRATGILEAAFNVPQGVPVPQFVAWHWRTGGQHGESGIIRQENKEAFRSRMQQLMASINCGRAMVLAQAVSAPLLVVTDLNPFRKWVRSGAMGPAVTTLPSVAQHVDMGDAPMESYLDVFADALALSRAKCVLVSQSGFSNTALMFHQQPLCYEHMDSCLRQQDSFFTGIEIRR